MFAVLNRLRGAYGWMAKVIGALLGGAFYLATSDLYISLAIAIGYILGESFGWGKWIGGIYSKHTVATAENLAEEEGYNNGVHWLANKIHPELVNYYHYCLTALALRGMLWFTLTLLPVYAAAYISTYAFAFAIIVLGIGFPISIILGAKTAPKFSFNYMEGYWEHAEVWYGLMQGIVLVTLAANILMP